MTESSGSAGPVSDGEFAAAGEVCYTRTVFPPSCTVYSPVAQLVERLTVSGAGSEGVEKRRYADRRAYMIDAVRRRRKKVRQMAVEYKGGKCGRCGYSKCVEALEFHHLDSSQKDFGISEKGYTRSWTRVREELDKCILVCANCHRELHALSQLLRESGVETAGELREAYVPTFTGYGNPEPSPCDQQGKVQRLSARHLYPVLGSGW